jgi:thiol peroxidase
VEERSGEAFELDERLTVLGRRLEAGESAPPFALDHLDPGDGAVKTVRLSDSAGAVRLLNVVNSLDTPVCQVETRRWEELQRELPAGAVVYTVSMDLPWAQSRWCAAEGVGLLALSALRSEEFGRAYGVLL